MQLYHIKKGVRVTRDGKTHEPEYETWVRMQRRCYEPKYKGYKHYGGRGITVCEAWRLDYRAFIRDVGRKPSPKHSLDRIDCDGNYEPSNVRWATIDQQAANRRNLRLITFRGETKSLAAWSRSLDINYVTLTQRLTRMPVTEAFTRKVRPKRAPLTAEQR